jgi:hypothetical protein
MQDHLPFAALYQKYPSTCDIPTVPFVNLGHVANIQIKLIMW